MHHNRAQNATRPRVILNANARSARRCTVAYHLALTRTERTKIYGRVPSYTLAHGAQECIRFRAILHASARRARRCTVAYPHGRVPARTRTTPHEPALYRTIPHAIVPIGTHAYHVPACGVRAGVSFLKCLTVCGGL